MSSYFLLVFASILLVMVSLALVERKTSKKKIATHSKTSHKNAEVAAFQASNSNEYGHNDLKKSA